MGSPFCYIKWVGGGGVVVVVLSLAFAGFGGFGFLTSIALILSTLLFTLTKQKPAIMVQKSVTEEGLINCEDDHQEIMMSSSTSSSPPSYSIEDHVVPTLPLPLQQQQQQPHQNETMTQHKEEEPQKGLENDQHDDHDQDLDHYSIKSSPDLLSSASDEQSLDDHLSTSEDSEVDWPFRDIIYQSPDCSDGSISDEESLIEIALPSGHYVDHNKEEQKQQEEPNKFNPIQQIKVPDHLPQSILKQHSLMELLAELNDINEEDNLIEIDISMGSIKCSRFEIEA